METGVIIAGGLGTRLRPLTNKTPKALLDIDGKNLTEHIILLLKKSGVKTIYLSLGHLSEKVMKFFGDEYEGIKIKYIVEEKPLGTGGWLKLVDKKDFKDDFIVVNGDDLVNIDFKKMLKIHKKNKALITLALNKIEDVRMFGVATLDGDKINGFVEKPEPEHAPSHWASNGHYIFSSEVFDILPKEEKFMLEMRTFPKAASLGRLFGYKNKSPWFTTNDKEQWENTKKNWKI